MPYNHKVELSKPERFVGGHRLCAGCGAGIVCRAMTRALDEGDKAVICNATGCLEVSSFLYPYTAWEDSYIHTAFENAPATCCAFWKPVIWASATCTWASGAIKRRCCNHGIQP